MTGLIGGVHAEEGKKDRPERKLPPEIVDKFDKDGDGELNEDERKAAREARRDKMKERREEMLKKYDADGDGKLDEEERKVAREAMKARMLERFDKDGDGELNDDERAEMRKEMKDRPHRHGHGKDGKRKGGNRKGKRGGNDAEAPGEL